MEYELIKIPGRGFSFFDESRGAFMMLLGTQVFRSWEEFTALSNQGGMDVTRYLDLKGLYESSTQPMGEWRPPETRVESRCEAATRLESRVARLTESFWEEVGQIHDELRKLRDDP